VKFSPAILFVTLALSLIAWATFYLLGTPLNSGESTVVVGLILVVVAVVAGIARRRRDTREVK
jgi:uncharacterized membrane protein